MINNHAMSGIQTYIQTFLFVYNSFKLELLKMSKCYVLQGGEMGI